jgi:hypothetical protein
MLLRVTEEVSISELKAARDQLFEKFERHPEQVHLALDIRVIDDRIMEIRDSRQTEAATLRFARSRRA